MSSGGYDIKGKVALVTGANRGIGKALVEGFLEHGAAKVYAAVRTPSTADDLVRAHGSDRVVPIFVDLSKPDSIREAAAKADDVQVVVNNAGILELAEPLSSSSGNDDESGNNDFLSAMERQMETNAYGLVHIAQRFVPVLKKNDAKGGGALVQINSTSSLRCPSSRFAAYSASKAAAYAITQGLRNSLPDTFVMSVHPGPIATDMVDQFGGRHRSEPASQVAEAVVEGLKKGTFLVYTDTLSREMGAAYEGFATGVIEPASRYSE